MKQSVIRMLSAALLRVLAVGIMAGAIGAVSEDAVQAWSRVRFQTGGQQKLRLYNAQGVLVETMTTDAQGHCTTELLEQGCYYVVCEDGLAEFSLDARGISEVKGAAEEGEKGILFAPAVGKGSVTIQRRALAESYEYELYSQAYSKSRSLYCAAGEQVSTMFEGLPYGLYTLKENGRALCRVELTEEKPEAVLCLP